MIYEVLRRSTIYEVLRRCQALFAKIFHVVNFTCATFNAENAEDAEKLNAERCLVQLLNFDLSAFSAFSAFKNRSKVRP